MRSLLFVPGNDRKKLAKGLASDADVMLIDLEDSIAASRKDEAREIASAFIAETRPLQKRPKLFVRVNAHSTGLTAADLDAVMIAQPDGIMLPKSRSGDDISLLAARLAVREAENGLPDGSTHVIAIATETATSIFHMGSYAGISQRLRGLTWGGEDLSVDVGAETNRLENGSYTDPYRLARASVPLCSIVRRRSPDRQRLYQFPRSRRPESGSGSSTPRRVHREDGDPSRAGSGDQRGVHPIRTIRRPCPPHRRAFARSPDAGVIGLDGEMLDRPHLRRAELVLEAAAAAGFQAVNS